VWSGGESFDHPVSEAFRVKRQWVLGPPRANGGGERGRRSGRQRHATTTLAQGAYSLTPQRVLVGAGEFDDYYAFILPGENRVLLENPVEGNAAYVFGRNWQALSRLSKTELLSEHAGDMIRVTHAGDWKSEIRAALKQISRATPPARLL